MSKLPNQLDRPAPLSCIRTKKKRTVNNISLFLVVCAATWQLTTKGLACTEEPSDMLHSTQFVTGDSFQTLKFMEKIEIFGLKLMTVKLTYTFI